MRALQRLTLGVLLAGTPAFAETPIGEVTYCAVPTQIVDIKVGSYFPQSNVNNAWNLLKDKRWSKDYQHNNTGVIVIVDSSTNIVDYVSEPTSVCKAEIGGYIPVSVLNGSEWTMIGGKHFRKYQNVQDGTIVQTDVDSNIIVDVYKPVK